MRKKIIIVPIFLVFLAATCFLYAQNETQAQSAKPKTDFGSVIKVISKDEIMIDVGLFDKIKTDDVVEIMKTTQITDPVTGEVTGEEDKAIAWGRIIFAKEKYSYAKIEAEMGPSEITSGDKVRKLLHQEINWHKDNSVMILIPAGEFMMGSPGGQGDTDEVPQHQVFLNLYYLDKYEVTNSQYAAFVNQWGKETDENGNAMFFSHEWGIKKINKKWQAAKGYENFPMVNVTWFGANQYAKWAGKRLPTEAEWEKAARSGSKTSYYFGNEALKLDDYAWYYNNSGGKTNPVGQKSANVWGFYDMYGNVAEWCQDWYQAGFYKRSATKNPKGAFTGNFRVVRGGSWAFPAKNCRSAKRDFLPQDFAGFSCGFRCASSKIKK